MCPFPLQTNSSQFLRLFITFQSFLRVTSPCSGSGTRCIQVISLSHFAMADHLLHVNPTRKGAQLSKVQILVRSRIKEF